MDLLFRLSLARSFYRGQAGKQSMKTLSRAPTRGYTDRQYMTPEERVHGQHSAQKLKELSLQDTRCHGRIFEDSFPIRGTHFRVVAIHDADHGIWAVRDFGLAKSRCSIHAEPTSCSDLSLVRHPLTAAERRGGSGSWAAD